VTHITSSGDSSHCRDPTLELILVTHQGGVMATDDRNLLDVLKFELEFLEKGGYGSSPREPWRCPLIFED
jgi:hypothetical protein